MELSSPQIISSQEESHCRNLPQEIIVEILLKLPVKPLLRFRCVSKSWFSLMSSGDFIKTHLKTSTKDSKYAHHSLLLHSNYTSRKFCSCSLYSVLRDNAPVYTELHLPLPDQYPQITIVGSCNGLFCIFERVQRVPILWNPSTRKYSKLSNSNTELHSFSYSTYGFGYDESHDDYKVVVLFCFRGAQFDFETEVISIYSLKTKSWRSTQINTSHTVASESAVFFNGVLHWGVANHGYARRSSFIVTFDLTKETFGETPLPNSLQDVNMSSRIGILGDCLSMVYHYYEVHTDIWVMNDYGVKESWTKLLTIQYNTGFVAYVSPIIVIEDGELLLMLGTSMMLYSPRDNTFKHSEIQSPGGPDCVGAAAVAYIESLVSPDS